MIIEATSTGVENIEGGLNLDGQSTDIRERLQRASSIKFFLLFLNSSTTPSEQGGMEIAQKLPSDSASDIFCLASVRLMTTAKHCHNRAIYNTSELPRKFARSRRERPPAVRAIMTEWYFYAQNYYLEKSAPERRSTGRREEERRASSLLTQ